MHYPKEKVYYKITKNTISEIQKYFPYQIRIEGNRKVVRTTRDGEFWRLLVPGNYRMQVRANGYRDSESVPVSVTRNNPTYKKIVLQRRN